MYVYVHVCMLDECKLDGGMCMCMCMSVHVCVCIDMGLTLATWLTADFFVYYI